MNTQNFGSFATKDLAKDEIHRLELKIEQSKVELIKIKFWSIYTATAVLFLSIVSAMIGIFNFMMHK